jgi:hypothetical protein
MYFKNTYSSESLVEQLRGQSKDLQSIRNSTRQTIMIDFDETQGIIEIKDPNRWKLDKLEEQMN